MKTGLSTKNKSLKAAVFFDRDGVLNEEVDVLRRIEELKMIESAPAALKKLQEAGFKLIVVTNQPVVARGWLTEKGVEKINRRLGEMYKKRGVVLDKFYFCSHHPEANLPQYRVNCNCRKPKPGMILQAAKDFQLDLKKSWLIGDSFRDILAGKAAGIKTIEIETVGKKVLPKEIPPYKPDLKVKTLGEAVDIIIK